MPELTDAFTRQQINTNQLQFGTQQPQITDNKNINTKNLLVENSAARWASPDSLSSEPRIINDPLKSFTQNPNHNIAERNGIVMTGMSMEPLTLECDPHAWDLKPDDIEFQKLFGNLCKYLYTYLFP